MNDTPETFEESIADMSVVTVEAVIRLRKRAMEIEHQRDKLLEALKFYANPEVYNPDSIGRIQDITYTANIAISSIESPTKEQPK